MNKHFIFFLLAAAIGFQEATAQDVQFSQFYAAPLYLNPALAGATGQARVGINYRNQWPAIDATFTTASAYFDYFIRDYNSGVGIIINTDKEGLAGLQSNNVAINYAYHLNISKNLTVRPGLSAGYTIRNIDFNKLTFGDQFDASTGEVVLPTSGEGLSLENVGYLDLGAGVMVYSNNLWVGFSASHLNVPDQSFSGGESRLARKYSAHAGYKIRLKSTKMTGGQVPTRRERSITPTVHYKHQGKFDQLDLGVYFTLEPLILGATYRGLPIKKLEGFPNNESAIVLIGFNQGDFNVGYSFDYTLSGLGINSGGAHEISISYNFSIGKEKPPKNVRQIPCPSF